MVSLPAPLELGLLFVRGDLVVDEKGGHKGQTEAASLARLAFGKNLTKR